MYLLIVRMNAANKRRGIDILFFTVSASNGRAAVAAGDDLRGLGNCHQQAFLGICRNGKSPKISKLTEVCIACRFVNRIISELQYKFQRMFTIIVLYHSDKRSIIYLVVSGGALWII